MSRTFEDLAKAADEVADDQRQLARDARAMQRSHDEGAPLGAVLDTEAGAGFVSLLRASVRRLASASGHFTQSLARELSREGESRRRIANRLGVSHQRVSAMLNHQRPSAPSE